MASAMSAASVLTASSFVPRARMSRRAPAGVARKATVTRMGMGFHESMPAGPPRIGDLESEDKQLFGGLSGKQLEILGLTKNGAPMGMMEPISAELVTAKYNYRREVPSMEAYRTPTSMSGGGVPGQAPPDLPSLLLNSRIVYLGMPLVPAVTELLVAELLYMGFDNPEKPVYLYINSSGSQTQNGEAVGFETEAYAIMDTMRYVKPDMHTVCVGKAWGNAAMLLASGKKGYRHALPHASIMTCPPRMNRAQDCATNVMIKANELAGNTDTYVDFLTEFTGKEREEIYEDVGRTRWFTPKGAIEYGLIDKVVEQGLNMEKKDYERMLQMAQAQAAGGR